MPVVLQLLTGNFAVDWYLLPSFGSAPAMPAPVLGYDPVILATNGTCYMPASTTIGVY